MDRERALRYATDIIERWSCAKDVSQEEWVAGILVECFNAGAKSVTPSNQSIPGSTDQSNDSP